MADNIHLKAFIRLDGQNRVVAGSLIYRKSMPKNGKWVEIPTGKCCVPDVAPFILPTTSTTTTLEPLTTTTTTEETSTTTTSTTIP